MARMSRDAALMRVPLPGGAVRLENSLLRLVERNQAFLSTMRVAVVRNRGGMWEGPDQTRPSDIIAFTADIKHWAGSVRLNYVPQARHAARRAGDLLLHFWRVHQVQGLRHRRLAGAAARTRAGALGAAEDVEEVRWQAIVPQLDRPRPERSGGSRGGSARPRGFEDLVAFSVS